MLVKICGITRPEDAARAVALGAGAIGFIFWPASPRYIDPYRARAIVRSIPAFVTTVGVFVNQPPDAVNGVAAVAGLSAVQLHGDEPADMLSAIKRPVIKALSRIDGSTLTAWDERVTLLIDAHDPVRRGGTGERADWPQAAAVAKKRRVVLAGGLNAENIGAALREVAPFGVDVSSGVESSPGIKDHLKLTAFFEALHQS
jgi:phosphoribosylanthranilate isomerase